MRKRAREAVCAFANNLPDLRKPGIIFIGATDSDAPSGKQVDMDELMRWLADMATDGHILPLPVITVEKRVLKGAEMAIVMVLPSDMPPVRYDGRIWIRVGSRRALANEQKERILVEKRRFRDIPYDVQPVLHATLDDLERHRFESDYLPKAFAPDVLQANAQLR